MEDITYLLLVIAVVSGILALFYKFLKGAKIFFTIAIFLLSITGFILKYIKEQSEKKQRDTEYHTTLGKVDTTIHKADSTLKRLNLVLDKSESSLRKNDSIINYQFGIYLQIDRISQPLFPLSFSIQMDVSFNNRDVRPFTKYIEDKVKKEGTGFTLFNEWLSDQGLEQEVPGFFSMFYHSGFEVTIIKEPNNFKIRSVRDLKPTMPNISFEIRAEGPFSYTHKSWYMNLDYPARMFRVSQRFDSVTFSKLTIDRMQTAFGFNELENCWLLFRPFSASKHLLKRIVIASEAGIRKYCSFKLTEKDKDFILTDAADTNFNPGVSPLKHRKVKDTVYVYFHKIQPFEIH
jgi:hypothetical protein